MLPTLLVLPAAYAIWRRHQVRSRMPSPCRTAPHGHGIIGKCVAAAVVQQQDMAIALVD